MQPTARSFTSINKIARHGHSSDAGPLVTTRRLLGVRSSRWCLAGLALRGQVRVHSAVRDPAALLLVLADIGDLRIFADIKGQDQLNLQTSQCPNPRQLARPSNGTKLVVPDYSWLTSLVNCDHAFSGRFCWSAKSGEQNAAV